MHVNTSSGGAGGRGYRGLRTIEDSSARLFGISTVQTVSLGTLRAAACTQRDDTHARIRQGGGPALTCMHGPAMGLT